MAYTSALRSKRPHVHGGKRSRGLLPRREWNRMARPKLPIDQRRRLTMTVRIRQDLDEGFAAVAHVRGTTKSGLVSQYAAEQIRVEQERDSARFDAALKEIKSVRKIQQNPKSSRA